MSKYMSSRSKFFEFGGPSHDEDRTIPDVWTLSPLEGQWLTAVNDIVSGLFPEDPWSGLSDQEIIEKCRRRDTGALPSVMLEDIFLPEFDAEQLDVSSFFVIAPCQEE